ncbi:MAG: hypothetical protein ACYCOU_24355 [Sulfobacillus sp.]
MAMGPNESGTPGSPGEADLTDKVSVSYLILSRLDDLKRDQERLWQEVGGLRQEMKQEIGGLRQEFGSLRQEMNALRQDMKQDVTSLRQEISALRYWSWGSIIAVLIGVITIIVTNRP